MKTTKITLTTALCTGILSLIFLSACDENDIANPGDDSDEAVDVMEQANERAVADPTFDGKVTLDRQGYDELIKRLAKPTPNNASVKPMSASEAVEYIRNNDARDAKEALRVVSLPPHCQISSYHLQGTGHP